MPETEINYWNKLQQARILIDQHNYIRAKELLRQVLEADVNNADAYSVMGLCESNMGNYAKAEELHSIALGLEPENDYLHYLRAFNFHRMDEHNRSLKTIDEALRIEPEKSEYLSLRAINLLNIGQYFAAKETIESALRLRPDNDNLLRIRALVYQHMGNLKDANREIDHSLSENPESSLAHSDKAGILLSQGRVNEATGVLRDALRLDPDNKYAKTWMLSAMKLKVPIVGKLMEKGFERRIWNYTGAKRIWYIIIVIIVSHGTALIGFPLFYGLFWSACAIFSLGFDAYISMHPTKRYLLPPREFRLGRITFYTSLVIAPLFIAAVATGYHPLWEVWALVLAGLPIYSSYFHLNSASAKRGSIIIMAAMVILLGFILLAGFIPLMLSVFGMLSLYFFVFTFRLFGR